MVYLFNVSLPCCYAIDHALATKVEKTYAGYVVNNKTIKDVISACEQGEKQEKSALHGSIAGSYNNVKAYVQQAGDNEESCRNIIEKDSHYYRYIQVFGWPNPSDYERYGFGYIHRFFSNGSQSIMTCYHNSLDSLKQHNYWINEYTRADEKLQKMPQNVDGGDVSAIENKWYKNFVEELKPFVDKKLADEKVFLDSVTNNIESFECSALLGTEEILKIKFLKKKKWCKKRKMCNIKVRTNWKEEVGIGCSCGHYFAKHKFNFKPNVNAEDVLNKMKQHEYCGGFATF